MNKTLMFVLFTVALTVPCHAEDVSMATVFLQRMIDTGAGLVEFPAGTHVIDAPLVVDLTKTGYRGLRGANGATRIVMTAPGPAIRIIGNHQGTANPASVTEHTWEAERFPVVSGLEILGRHPEADGIELRRTIQCTIQNVLIRNCRYGVHLVERNRNFLLADSHIYDCHDSGVFLDNCNLHQVNIIGNHISYNKRAGIRQYNGDVHNVQITGNDIEYNHNVLVTKDGAEQRDDALMTGEIVLESPDSLISEYTIVSNTIQAIPQSRGANIMILGSEKNSPHAARTIAISGNIIGSRDKNIVLEHAVRVTITGNTIYGGQVLNVQAKHTQNLVLSANNIGSRPSMHKIVDGYDDGILLENCANAILDGNILSNLRYGSAGHGGAVTLINARNIRVSDCQIIHPHFRGIHLINGLACVFSDNTIESEGEDFQTAIEVSGKSQSNLVQQNLMIADPAKSIRMRENTGTRMGNTIVAEK